MRQGMIRFGNFIFKYRDLIFPWVLLGSILVSKPMFSAQYQFYDSGLDLLGWMSALLGQSLRALTIGYEYIKRGGMNKKIYAEGLVTGGVFAHSRNPLYLGNLLVLFGLAFIANSCVVYGIAIPFFLFSYMALISAEEEFLLKKFGGTYRDYCKVVNRFWPCWDGFRDTVRDIKFNWKRVVNKEHGSFFAWTVSAVLIHVWSQFYYQGPSAFKDCHSIGLLIFLGLSYACVRILKKRRLLN